jgi:hypothetical protein
LEHLRLKTPPESDPGVLISDPVVRDLFYRFLVSVRDIHDDVRIETARLDLRIFWKDTLLCRVAPYRELFHIQVENDGVWETRVRDRKGCIEAIDRVLVRFLGLRTGRE